MMKILALRITGLNRAGVREVSFLWKRGMKVKCTNFKIRKEKLY